MTSNPQQSWNDCYDQGRDFTLISSQAIDRFLCTHKTDASKTALDIGCGTGQLTRELWHRGYKVVGVDVSGSAIKIAQSLTIVPEEELCYEQIDIEQDNTDELPFQPYGLITCKLVYAFIQDKPLFLERVAQLLDPQGLFVIITPLVGSMPPERRGITVTEDDIHLLNRQFKNVASYEERELGYFFLRK